MKYFHDHKRLVPKGKIRSDVEFLLGAIKQAMGRAQHQVKGRKRLYASSLAFKTILALVPALAIVMAVLAGDAFSEKREQVLDQIVDVLYPVDSSDLHSVEDPQERQNLQQLNQAGKQQIRRSVQKFAVYSRKAGFAGFLGFALIVFLLLRDVEGAFNFLWGLEAGRPIMAQITRHSSLLLATPLLASFLATLKGWVKALGLLKTSGGAWFFTGLIPFLGLWVLCSLMYFWIPNTKVDRRSAVWSGFLVAILLELAQSAMGWYTLHVLAGSRVYGALWVIPVILIWFYLSWTVVLFGAEAAYFMHKDRMEIRR